MAKYERAVVARVALGTGSLVAGLGALAFILVATRELGLNGFAPISQLWTVWAIAAAVLTFSSQQITIRHIVLGTDSSSSLVGRFAPTALMVTVLVPVLLVFRQRLFLSDSPAWLLVGVLIPFGSLAIGVARGRLAATDSIGGLVFVVAGENLVRALMAVVLAWFDAEPIWYGGAILAGFAVAAAGWLRIDPEPAVGAAPSPSSDRFLPLATSIAGLCGHGILVVAPSALAIGAASPEVISAVFIVLAVYRAPYQLVMGYAPRLANAMARRSTRFEIADRRLIVEWVWGSVGAAALVGGILATAIGESIIAPLFGAEGWLSRLDHALAAALTVAAVGTLYLTMTLVAEGRVRALLLGWIPSSLAGMALLSVLSLQSTGYLAVLLGTDLVVLMVLGLTFAVETVPRRKPVAP